MDHKLLDTGREIDDTEHNQGKRGISHIIIDALKSLEGTKRKLQGVLNEVERLERQS